MPTYEPSFSPEGTDPEILSALDWDVNEPRLVLFVDADRSRRLALKAAALRHLRESKPADLILFSVSVSGPPNDKGRAGVTLDRDGGARVEMDAVEHERAIVGGLRLNPDILSVEDVDLSPRSLSACASEAVAMGWVLGTIEAGGVLGTLLRARSVLREGTENPSRDFAKFLGGLRMILSETTLPGTDGGTVTCREFLVLDRDDRREMFRVLDWGGDPVANAWKLMDSGVKGRTMRASARRLLESGAISEGTHAAFVDSLNFKARALLKGRP